MKASKFFYLSAALLALVLSAVSANAQDFHKNGPKAMGNHPKMEMNDKNIEKIAERKADRVRMQYNLDQASYRKLVNYYKKEMKQMKKQGKARMDQEKELKAILGPENYKAYKHDAKMHGYGHGHGPGMHHGMPDRNHVEKPVPQELK